MSYDQFCPIAKAAEILGERWTILIVRELIMGGCRFNQLQRGLGDISPALLATRLKSLEAHNLVIRRRIDGQRGSEYLPTAACDALLPVLMSIGEWGMSFARQSLVDKDFDVDFLMLYLERSIDTAQLPGDRSCIRFEFTDLGEHRNWWLVVKHDDVQICLTPPPHDVNVYLTTTVRVMHDVWVGDRSYRDATASSDLIVEGDPLLTRTISRWLRPSAFAHVPRALAA